MLITEQYTDLSTSYGVLRTHLFVPTMPGSAANKDAKFPGIVVFSEIYQVNWHDLGVMHVG